MFYLWYSMFCVIFIFLHLWYNIWWRRRHPNNVVIFAYFFMNLWYLLDAGIRFYDIIFYGGILFVCCILGYCKYLWYFDADGILTMSPRSLCRSRWSDQEHKLLLWDSVIHLISSSCWRCGMITPWMTTMWMMTMVLRTRLKMTPPHTSHHRACDVEW